VIKRFADIYIGSNRCTFIAGQRGSKGSINILDRITQSTNLGRQSFGNGEISFGAVARLCKILNDFISVAECYGIEEIEIFGTAALREAKNKRFILEQIRMQTGGYTVRMLEHGEETEMIFKHALFSCDEVLRTDILEQNGVLMTIANSHISTALVREGLINYFKTEEIGYLKIKEMVETIESRTQYVDHLLSDFIDLNIERTLHVANKIQNKFLLVSTHDAKIISQLAKGEKRAGVFKISKEQLNTLLDHLIDLSTNQVQKKYPQISGSDADTLRHTLMICKKFLEVLNLEYIYMVQMDLALAALEFKFNKVKEKKLDVWIEDSAYTCVQKVAQKYRVDVEHIKAVEKYALKIYNGLKKAYSLSKREKFLLQYATQLIDIGRYIGNHSVIPCNKIIVDHEGLIGLTETERTIVGIIADGVRNNLIKFDLSTLDSYGLADDDELSVAYLIAILKLATALDKSHRQKINKISCRIEKNLFIVNAYSGDNIQLEAYYFELLGEAIEQVFGLKPVLKIKRSSVL